MGMKTDPALIAEFVMNNSLLLVISKQYNMFLFTIAGYDIKKLDL